MGCASVRGACVRGPASLPSRRVSLCPSRAPRPPVNVPRPSQLDSVQQTCRQAAEGTGVHTVQASPGPRLTPWRHPSVHKGPWGAQHICGARSVEGGLTLWPRALQKGATQAASTERVHRGRAGLVSVSKERRPAPSLPPSAPGAGRAVPALKELPLHGRDVQREQGRHQGGESMEGFLEEASGVSGGALEGG